MSAADVPLREVVKRLQRRVDALSAAIGALVAQLSGTAKFTIVETALDVELGDYSKFDLLVVMADEDNAEPGLFRKVAVTGASLNGRDAIADVAGTKFERFVNT